MSRALPSGQAMVDGGVWLIFEGKTSKQYDRVMGARGLNFTGFLKGLVYSIQRF